MAERPFVPRSFSDVEEQRRKLADAIIWIMDRLDELEDRIEALE